MASNKRDIRNMTTTKHPLTFPSTLFCCWILFLSCALPLVRSDGSHIERRLRLPETNSSKKRKSAKLKTSESPYVTQDGTLQSTIDGTPKCFCNAEEATRLGSLVLNSLWYEIAETKCKPEQIAQIYDAYFRSDMIVTNQDAEILVEGLDAYKEYSIGDAKTPGSMVYACIYQHLSFEPTQVATTEPGIYSDFVWIGNRIVHSVGDIIQPQYVLIEMCGASGSFLYNGKGGQSSKHSPWFYEAHGGTKKGSNSETPNCHKPQIYGIVLLDE